MLWLIADYLIVALALLGAYLNARQMRMGFFLWIITNTYLAEKNFFEGQLAQSMLFTAYLGLAIYGYVRFKNDET